MPPPQQHLLSLGVSNIKFLNCSFFRQISLVLFVFLTFVLSLSSPSRSTATHGQQQQQSSLAASPSKKQSHVTNPLITNPKLHLDNSLPNLQQQQHHHHYLTQEFDSFGNNNLCPEASRWPEFCGPLFNTSILSEISQGLVRERVFEAKSMFCDKVRILNKIDCAQPFTVSPRWRLGCQEAYRDWTCSILAEPYMPEGLPSCDSTCHHVIRNCPYLSPDRVQAEKAGPHPSQYGGHPAFFCPINAVGSHDSSEHTEDFFFFWDESALTCIIFNPSEAQLTWDSFPLTSIDLSNVNFTFCHEYGSSGGDNAPVIVAGDSVVNLGGQDPSSSSLRQQYSSIFPDIRKVNVSHCCWTFSSALPQLYTSLASTLRRKELELENCVSLYSEDESSHLYEENIEPELIGTLAEQNKIVLQCFVGREKTKSQSSLSSPLPRYDFEGGANNIDASLPPGGGDYSKIYDAHYYDAGAEQQEHFFYNHDDVDANINSNNNGGGGGGRNRRQHPSDDDKVHSLEIKSNSARVRRVDNSQDNNINNNILVNSIIVSPYKSSSSNPNNINARNSGADEIKVNRHKNRNLDANNVKNNNNNKRVVGSESDDEDVNSRNYQKKKRNGGESDNSNNNDVHNIIIETDKGGGGRISSGNNADLDEADYTILIDEDDDEDYSSNGEDERTTETYSSSAFSTDDFITVVTSLSSSSSMVVDSDSPDSRSSISSASLSSHHSHQRKQQQVVRDKRKAISGDSINSSPPEWTSSSSSSSASRLSPPPSFSLLIEKFNSAYSQLRQILSTSTNILITSLTSIIATTFCYFLHFNHYYYYWLFLLLLILLILLLLLIQRSLAVVFNNNNYYYRAKYINTKLVRFMRTTATTTNLLPLDQFKRYSLVGVQVLLLPPRSDGDHRRTTQRSESTVRLFLDDLLFKDGDDTERTRCSCCCCNSNNHIYLKINNSSSISRRRRSSSSSSYNCAKLVVNATITSSSRQRLLLLLEAAASDACKSSSSSDNNNDTSTRRRKRTRRRRKQHELISPILECLNDIDHVDITPCDESGESRESATITPSHVITILMLIVSRRKKERIVVIIITIVGSSKNLLFFTTPYYLLRHYARKRRRRRRRSISSFSVVVVVVVEKFRLYKLNNYYTIVIQNSNQSSTSTDEADNKQDFQPSNPIRKNYCRRETLALLHFNLFLESLEIQTSQQEQRNVIAKKFSRAFYYLAEQKQLLLLLLIRALTSFKSPRLLKAKSRQKELEPQKHNLLARTTQLFLFLLLTILKNEISLLEFTKLRLRLQILLKLLLLHSSNLPYYTPKPKPNNNNDLSSKLISSSSKSKLHGQRSTSSSCWNYSYSIYSYYYYYYYYNIITPYIAPPAAANNNNNDCCSWKLNRKPIIIIAWWKTRKKILLILLLLLLLLQIMLLLIIRLRLLLLLRLDRESRRSQNYINNKIYNNTTTTKKLLLLLLIRKLSMIKYTDKLYVSSMLSDKYIVDDGMNYYTNNKCRLLLRLPLLSKKKITKNKNNANTINLCFNFNYCYYSKAIIDNKSATTHSPTSIMIDYYFYYLRKWCCWLRFRESYDFQIFNTISAACLHYYCNYNCYYYYYYCYKFREKTVRPNLTTTANNNQKGCVESNVIIINDEINSMNIVKVEEMLYAST